MGPDFEVGDHVRVRGDIRLFQIIWMENGCVWCLNRDQAESTMVLVSVPENLKHAHPEPEESPSPCDEPCHEPFPVGSVVQLKSGGPPLTVAGVIEGVSQVICLWFYRGKLRQDNFSVYALKPY